MQPEVTAALGQLSSKTTLEGIKSLAGSLSASASGSGGVIYSGLIGEVSSSSVGKTIASTLGVSIIDNTARAEFLRSPLVTEAVERILTAEGIALPEIAGKVTEFIFGGQSLSSMQSSLWGEASRDFVRSLSGEVLVIASEANPFRIFAQIEIPELLANHNVQTIGGRAVETLTGLFLDDTVVAVQQSFKSAVTVGGLFTSHGAAGELVTVVSKQMFSALGHTVEAAPEAAQLAATGFEQLVLHSPGVARNLFAIAGHGALKFFGSAAGGALLDLLLSSDPLNANERNIQALSSDIRSDLPDGVLADAVKTNADGTASIQLQLTQQNGNPAIDVWLKVSGSGVAESISIINPQSNQNTSIEHSAGTTIDISHAGLLFTRAEDGSLQVVIPGTNGEPPRTIVLNQTTGEAAISGANQVFNVVAGSNVSVAADGQVDATEFWNGQVKSFTHLNANLSRTVETWDVQNQQSWSKQTANYDSAGRLDQVETVGDSGIKTIVDRDQDSSKTWSLQRTVIDSDGRLLAGVEIGDNSAVTSVVWNGGSVSVGDIGSALGSSLGRFLGGNSLIGKVAAGTLAGAIGKEIGNALQYGASFSLDVVVANGLANIPGGFAGGLPGAAIGAISSLLIGEVADALNLSGFEGGLVQTVGTTVTSQLLTNAYNVAVLGQPTSVLVTGFNTVEFAANITGAIGGYLGSTLAAHVVIPHYPEGALGQQIGTSVGASVGAIVGTTVGGPLGAFMFSAIGSFVGGAFGTFFGDLAGDDPEAHGDLVFDFTTHRFKADDSTFGHSNGGNATTLYLIAEHEAKVVNALADFAGAQLEGMETVGTIYGAVRIAEKLHLEQDGRYYTVREDYQNPFITLNNVQTRDDLTPLVDSGIMQILQHTDIIGGDPLVRLAWDNSHAQTAAEFGFDLQVAKDYRTYLDDKAAIDALMASEPESLFTAGWVLTLLKARELGLDAQPANDDFRAGNDTINGTAAGELLVGGAGHDIIDGGAGNDRIRGDAGNDVMRGGVGNDILIGGADVDTAVLAGPRSAYTLSDLGGGIVGVAGPDGSDTLVQMERLQFDDQVVTLPLFRDLTATLSLAGRTATYGVSNVGTLAIGNWFTTSLYLSADTTITAADTLLSSTAFPLNGGATRYESATLSLPGNLAPGTYYLGARADTAAQVTETDELNNVSALIAIMLGNDSANTLTGTDGNDTIFALGGNDVIRGGLGADTLIGGSGADRFVIPASAVTAERIFTAHATVDRILDYSRGAGDQVDVSALTGYWHSIDQPVPVLVRVVASGTGASVQVDTDGNYNGQKWVTVARLEGVHAGDTVNAIIHSSLPAGTDLIVQNRVDGDFTGDGGADIFWRTDGGALAYWDMNGSQISFGSYLRAGTTNVGVPDPSWHIMGTADFDGDGKRDILWVTDSDALAIWLMDGAQIKSADYVRNNGSASGVPPGWNVVGAADIDGDSMADLLIRNNNGNLGVWTMTGSAIKCGDYLWSGANPATAGADWHLARTDDFDGDGIKDLLWRTDSGALAVWEMDGSHVKEAGYLHVGATQVGAPAPDWRIAGSGDFDGDGRADILWKTDGGALAIWELDGTQIKSSDYLHMGSTLINTPGSDWHIAGIGDYDADGKSDILWNTDGGTLAVWTMNGTQITMADYIRIGTTQINTPAPDWHIVQPNYDLL